MLAAVFLIPFARFLLYHQYGLLHAEALAPLFAGLLLCIAAALVTRRPWIFATLVITGVVLHSAGRIFVSVAPFSQPQYRWILLGVSAVLIAFYRLMGPNLFTLLTVFSLGMFGVDLVQAATSGSPQAGAKAAAPGQPHPHAIHFILDEFLGTGAYPPIGTCPQTAAQLEQTLLRHSFDVYANAFSNYKDTIHSIPSIVNFKVEDASILTSNGRLTSEKLFSVYRSRGFAIAIYESDFLSFAAPTVKPDELVYSYRANSLLPVQPLDLPWTQKMEHIVAAYAQADVFWERILQRALPHTWIAQSRKIGPLSLGGLWPGRLTRDIQAAPRKTFFFAHLLAPHFPYVFDSSGRLTDYRDWGVGFKLHVDDEAAYSGHYRKYCEQVSFLTRQIDGFLTDLERSPAYDQMEIVLQGDHGSRLGVRRQPLPEARYLQDHFATLFAYKPAKPHQGVVIPRRASVTRLLAEALVPAEAAALPGPASEQVFVPQETSEGEDGVPRVVNFVEVLGTVK